MFNNLRAELVRRNIKPIELAEQVNMNYRTLMNRLAGKSDFNLPEMKLIKSFLKDPTLTLDYLFENN